MTGLSTSEINTEDLNTKNISAEVWLLTYKALKIKDGCHGVAKSIRSSILEYSNGNWQILFHQVPSI